MTKKWYPDQQARACRARCGVDDGARQAEARIRNLHLKYNQSDYEIPSSASARASPTSHRDAKDQSRRSIFADSFLFVFLFACLEGSSLQKPWRDWTTPSQVVQRFREEDESEKDPTQQHSIAPEQIARAARHLTPHRQRMSPSSAVLGATRAVVPHPGTFRRHRSDVNAKACQPGHGGHPSRAFREARVPRRAGDLKLVAVAGGVVGAAAAPMPVRAAGAHVAAADAQALMDTAGGVLGGGEARRLRFETAQKHVNDETQGSYGEFPLTGLLAILQHPAVNDVLVAAEHGWGTNSEGSVDDSEKISRAAAFHPVDDCEGSYLFRFPNPDTTFTGPFVTVSCALLVTFTSTTDTVTNPTYITSALFAYTTHPYIAQQID